MRDRLCARPGLILGQINASTDHSIGGADLLLQQIPKAVVAIRGYEMKYTPEQFNELVADHSMCQSMLGEKSGVAQAYYRLMIYYLKANHFNTIQRVEEAVKYIEAHQLEFEMEPLYRALAFECTVDINWLRTNKMCHEIMRDIFAYLPSARSGKCVGWTYLPN